MSRRHPEAKPPFKQPEPIELDGVLRKRCRWCWSAIVVNGRSTWCSDECVAEYRTAFDWNFARRAAIVRDRQICQICGTDCAKLNRILKAHAKSLWKMPWHEHAIGASHIFGTKRGSFAIVEVDHIVPRELGGTNELHNLRTLCPACHLDVCRRQAAERAERKRAAKAGLFVQEVKS